jgi:hypothetical protein
MRISGDHSVVLLKKIVSKVHSLLLAILRLTGSQEVLSVTKGAKVPRQIRAKHQSEKYEESPVTERSIGPLPKSLTKVLGRSRQFLTDHLVSKQPKFPVKFASFPVHFPWELREVKICSSFFAK